MLSSIENQVVDLEWVSFCRRALKQFRRAGHDVCLLDYRIGCGDGLRLLKESRKTFHNAPVILLTGVADYRLEHRSHAAGAADFLVKIKSLRHCWSARSAMPLPKCAIWRTEAEQDELRASELRFRSVVQSAADAIIWQTRVGKSSFGIKALKQSLAMERTRLRGRHRIIDA